jgi:elongation factor G
VDVIGRRAFSFEGANGVDVTERPVPAELVKQMEEVRAELVERLAEVDDHIGELFLEEKAPSVDDIRAAVRRATIALKFVPVFCGSAYKNKGVQLLLDGVVDYLPNPTEKTSVALDRDNGEVEVALSPDPAKPLVALAFKLQESRFGQLTYMRLYQGTMRKVSAEAGAEGVQGADGVHA